MCMLVAWQFLGCDRIEVLSKLSSTRLPLLASTCSASFILVVSMGTNVGAEGLSCTVAFIMLMASTGTKKHTDHLDRFKEMSNYKECTHKALVSIGSERNVKARVNDSLSAEKNVEIIGLIPSIAHDSYTVYVKSANGTNQYGPIHIECDCVARSFTGDSDDTWTTECVQQLTDFDDSEGQATSSAPAEQSPADRKSVV